MSAREMGGNSCDRPFSPGPQTGIWNFGPWSPFPAVTLLPSLIGSVLVGGTETGYWLLRYVLPVIIGPAVFYGWNPQLLRGIETVPKRSWIGLVVLTALTIYFFVSNWSLGIQYQGWSYTTTMAFVNGVALILCWGALLRAHRRPTFGRSLLFHWAATVWLVWWHSPCLASRCDAIQQTRNLPVARD
jgi:hypothetical protein